MFAPLQGLVGLEAIPRVAPVATGEHTGFCWSVVAQPIRKLRLSSSPARSFGAFIFPKMISIYPQTYLTLYQIIRQPWSPLSKNGFANLFLDHNPKKFPVFVTNLQQAR
jgi:hypothetical protein